PESHPLGQPSHLPPPEGGEDFLGLEQLLGGGPAEVPAAGPQPLLPDVAGERGDAELAQLMGAPLAPELTEECFEETPDEVIDPEPMQAAGEHPDDEDAASDADSEPKHRRVPTRRQISIVCGSLLCIWSLSQWDSSAGPAAPLAPLAPVALVSEAPVAPQPSMPAVQAPAATAVEAPMPSVVEQASARPVAVVAPLRARLTALLRMAASMTPSTPGSRMVPGTQDQALASSAPPQRPHRGRRSWRASLDLILGQSVGAQDVQMGNLLLGGGWNPLGSEPIVLHPNDLAPQGLGMLSSQAFDLPTSSPSSTVLEDQRAFGPGDSFKTADLMAAATPSLDDPSMHEPLRGLSPVPQGNRWTRPEIPESAISQADRLLTPGVGAVRATLHGGAVFEGRLHQVGMGQIWIDTRLGRMSLEAHRLASLETLETPGIAQTGDRLGSRQIGQLTQVSVGVPGGLLTGTLLSRDGDDVTLRIANGLQVTVTSTDVRVLAGASATLGVRPRGVGTQE
ncbi:MAG: hypothetical protein ABGY29_06005, partial [bacterium]